jgi:hypothetical protein
MIFTKCVVCTMKKETKSMKEYCEIKGKKSKFSNVRIGSWKINYTGGEGE